MLLCYYVSEIGTMSLNRGGQTKNSTYVLLSKFLCTYV